MTTAEVSVQFLALMTFAWGLAFALVEVVDEIAAWRRQRRIARADAWLEEHQGESWPPAARALPPMPPIPPPPPPRPEWKREQAVEIATRRGLGGTYCSARGCLIEAAALFSGVPYCRAHLGSELQAWLTPPAPPRPDPWKDTSA